MNRTFRLAMSILGVLALLLVGLNTTAVAKNTKVDVCHVTGNGSIIMLNVNENALQAHLNHGDYVPIEFFADADGDDYGDATVSVTGCTEPAGFVADSTDCNDIDSAVNPGATEIEENGIDDDCDPDTPDEAPVVTCPCAVHFTTGNRYGTDITTYAPWSASAGTIDRILQFGQYWCTGNGLLSGRPSWIALLREPGQGCAVKDPKGNAEHFILSPMTPTEFAACRAFMDTHCGQ